MPKLKSYNFTNQAKKDFKNIVDYTIDSFDTYKAIEYVKEIRNNIDRLMAHPGLGRAVDIKMPKIRMFKTYNLLFG